MLINDFKELISSSLPINKKMFNKLKTQSDNFSLEVCLCVNFISKFCLRFKYWFFLNLSIAVYLSGKLENYILVMNISSLSILNFSYD